MIYLNHSATSYPKPGCVTDKVAAMLASLPSGQFRSSGGEESGELFTKAREGMARILGVSDPARIFFTSGSTEALNLLIRGLRLRADEFLTTSTEHNSVLRPLYNLTEGALPHIVPCDASGRMDLSELEAAITPQIRALIFNHCSNVTGAIADAAAIGEIARRHHLIYLLDVSQSAGCIPLHLEEWGVHAAAFTGHKALCGIQGTGGMYIAQNQLIYPTKFGGSGRDSRRIRYESDFEFEVGTQNAPGIGALAEATQYLLEQGIDHIRAHELHLIRMIREGLHCLTGVRVIGADDLDYGPVVSFLVEGMKPADISYILQSSFGIVTRSGLQCAPLIHDHIGSGEDGTIRVSVGMTNTEEEIREFLSAMKEITDGIAGG